MVKKVCDKINLEALNKKFKKASTSIKKRSSGEIYKAKNSQKLNRDHLFDK